MYLLCPDVLLIHPWVDYIVIDVRVLFEVEGSGRIREVKRVERSRSLYSTINS